MVLRSNNDPMGHYNLGTKNYMAEYVILL